MRILTIMALSLIVVFMAASVRAQPTSAGQAMFNRLIELSKIHQIDKRVGVTVGKVGGSYTDESGIIYLDAGDIKFCNRDINCIASIVAHEIGHNVIGHVRGNNYNIKQQEKDADLYAVKLLKLGGYNPCAGAGFFRALGARFGDAGGPEHPNNSVRVKYIEQACSAQISAPQYPWSGKGIKRAGNFITIHKVEKK